MFISVGAPAADIVRRLSASNPMADSYYDGSRLRHGVLVGLSPDERLKGLKGRKGAAAIHSPRMAHIHCASKQHKTTMLSQYPRHLATQIRRCLVSYSTATTRQLVEWAYGVKKRAKWMAWNVRRCCRYYGIRVVGKRGRSLLWALPDQKNKA